MVLGVSAKSQNQKSLYEKETFKYWKLLILAWYNGTDFGTRLNSDPSSTVYSQSLAVG